MSLKKDMRQLVEKVRAQGWRIEDRGSAWLCKSPDMRTIVTIHKTPSDKRAIRNAMSRLRAGGFDPDA